MEEKNIIDEKEKNNKNMNDDLSELKKIFNDKAIDSLLDDDNEYEIIKKQIEDYKKNQQKEIEKLENELKKLKEKNREYIDFDEANYINNINIDDKIIKQLKEDIIKQIEPKITNVIDKKIPNIEQIEKDIEINNKKYIEDEIKSLIKDNQDKIQLNNEKKERKVHVGQTKYIVKKKSNNLEKSNQNINVIKEEENDSNINLIPNHFNNNNNKYAQKNKDNNIDNNLNINISKKKPVIPNINIKPKEEIKRKPSNDNLFALFNDIFFKNKQQSSIKAEKIDDFHQEYFLNIFFKYKKENREKDLIDYFDNFLTANVFKIFERKDLSENILEKIRYNIQTLSVCFDLNKDTYFRHTHPNYQKNQGTRIRQASIDAAKAFRTKFNIGQNIINEEQLIKKCHENDNNINKVFTQIYG